MRDTLGSLPLSPALSSEYRGDCKRSYCDILGRYIELEDPGDVPFDDNPCTADRCISGVPKNEPFSDGIKCPDLDIGVCLVGECVDCSQLLDAYKCPGDNVCSGTHCVPPHCIDMVDGTTGDETDHNCGGSCAPCPAGDSCWVDADCISNHCVNELCEPSTHVDGVKNDGETGEDCGCSECQLLCQDGEGCLSAADCLSGVCYAGKCQVPACDDGAQNGTETGKDCGGDCPQPCPG